MPEVQEIQEVKVNVHIDYTGPAIKFDFYPGNPNFDYGLNKMVDADRWKLTGDGIWLGCEITEDEAIWIEKIAFAVWRQDGYEVIGRPKMKPEELEPWAVKEVKEPAGEPEKVEAEEVGQLSLF